MSRLSEMIARLCPNGVENRKLGEIAKVCRGVRVVKKELNDGGKYAVGYNGSILSIEPVDKTAQKAVQKGNGDVKHNVDIILKVMNASFSDTGLDVDTLNYICIHIK